MDLKEQLKGILNESDLAKYESDVTRIMNEAVTAAVAKETENVKKKYDMVAEQYCKKMIAEGVDAEKKVILESYEQKFNTLEETYLKKLDRFIESKIIPQVSDEKITTLAESQTFGPVVKGILQVLEENAIALDTDGTALLKEAKEEISTLRKERDKLLTEGMKKDEKIEGLATILLLNESTATLEPKQVKKVKKFFKGKSFDEVEGGVKVFIESVMDAAEVTPSVAPKDPKDVILEGAGVSPAVVPPVAPKVEGASTIPSMEEMVMKAAGNLI